MEGSTVKQLETIETIFETKYAELPNGEVLGYREVGDRD